MTSLQCQKKNGLEYAARPFANLNKVTPENKKKIDTLAACRTPDSIHQLSENFATATTTTTTIPTTTSVAQVAASVMSPPPPQANMPNLTSNPNNSFNRKR